MRQRILLVTVPVVLLIWVGLGTYLWQKHNTDLMSAEQDSRNLAQAFEENIRRSIEVIDTTIRALRIARAHDPAHFDLRVWERESGLTQDLTLQLSVADRTGEMVASNLGTGNVNRLSIADRDHFRVPRETAEDDLFISRPVLGRISHRWSVQFVRKLFDETGAFDGVIVDSLDPAFLSRFYKSLDIGNGALLLLGEDGAVRTAAPEAVAKLGEDLSQSQLMQGSSTIAPGTIRSRSTSDGIERIYSWRHVKPYGLIAVVGLSTDDALAEYWQQTWICLAIGLLATGLTVPVTVTLARHRRDLVRSREVLRAAVENISQGLLVVDGGRRVRVLNARVAELLELPPHLSKAGVMFDALLEWQLKVGEFAGQDDTGVRKLVASGGVDPGTTVYHRRRQNGTVLEVRTKVVGTGLVVRTFTDVTEQQRAAQVLAEARDAAEAAARTRSEFLAVMSHEIRTPLNGVIGVAGLLEDMELAPAQREYVRLIRQSGDHLLELLNDILDFSRLEAQRVELEAVAFDPGALIRGIVDLFLAQASSKGLHLSAVVDDAVPAAVLGDPGRLRQILLNLVGNAVKFTDRGWVSVTLTQKPSADGTVGLLFSVADSGIGMAPEAIEQMFQEFTQMDGSITRRFGGSGLGLAICRRLVEMMGGLITVESRSGEGSTFHFDVALKLADPALLAQPEQQEQPATRPSLQILLAEDNPTNRLVALRILERLGHRADAVGDGREALAALAVGRYDLVLMDVMMPEMDGLTATRHIRTGEAPGEHITIVGLTAGSGEENRAACLAAGMDAVTTKPVTLARLEAAMAEGCRFASQRTVTIAPEQPTSRLRELADMLGQGAVTEIIQSFTEDSQAQLLAMKQAADRNDVMTIHRLAHSVAGAARNVGEDMLAEQASLLEDNTGSWSPEHIQDAIAAMRTELHSVLARMGQAGTAIA